MLTSKNRKREREMEMEEKREVGTFLEAEADIVPKILYTRIV